MATTQRGEATKQRWADCEIIAHHFNEVFNDNITKNVVHDWLYKDLKETPILLEEIKAGVRTAVEQIPHLPCYARYVEHLNKPQPRIFSPKREEKLETPAEKLKVAMWFIAKFETPDAALRALKAGIAAMQELSDD